MINTTITNETLIEIIKEDMDIILRNLEKTEEKTSIKKMHVLWNEEEGFEKIGFNNLQRGLVRLLELGVIYKEGKRDPYIIINKELLEKIKAD